MRKAVFPLIGLFLWLPSRSAGQILYTDFVPDIFVSSQPAGLDSAHCDINQDLLIDFDLICWAYSTPQSSQYENKLESVVSEFRLAEDTTAQAQSVCGRINLDSNQWIGDNLFYNSPFPDYFYRAGSLAWCGGSIQNIVKFYPFRKILNGDTLYGWLRILPTGTSLTLYDAAINLNPGMGLFTGQVSTDVFGVNTVPGLVLISPNPATEELQITMNNFCGPSTVRIFDFTGALQLKTGSVSEYLRVDIGKLRKG